MALSAEDSRTAIGGALLALGTLGAIVVTGTAARAFVEFTEAGKQLREWLADWWR